MPTRHDTCIPQNGGAKLTPTWAPEFRPQQARRRLTLGALAFGRERAAGTLLSALCGCAPDTGQEAYGRGKEDSRVGRRYAGGRLDRRGAMLMSVSAALRFWFAGVDRQSAGLLR
jgi:hypothetical protein